MASRRDDRAQMILLAGILIVLAYLLFSTQTALLASIGQEAGRESTNPLHADYIAVRSGFAGIIESELTNSAGVVKCPQLLSTWKARVETIVAMLEQLQSNRGLSFHGVFVGSVIQPLADLDGDGRLEMVTEIRLYLTDGDSSITEEVRYHTECTV
jgi:hypothetical protein